MGWDIVFGAIVKPISDYFGRRQEIKAKEREQDAAIRQATVERQIDLIKQGLAADANWEMEFARQAASSWKDEFTLIVVAIPAVLCFVPGLDVYVLRGFAALNTTPAWYQFLFTTLFLATVGIRFWRKNQSDT